jgi:dipeptidyl aminopeptidase/acylaminoacyl peptidase
MISRRGWIGCAILGLATAPLPGQARSPADTTDRLRQFFGYASLIHGGQVSPRWLADGQAFWYVDRWPDSIAIVRADPRSRRIAPLFDLTRLRRALVASLGKAPPGRGVPFDSLRLTDGDRSAEFVVEGQRFSLRFADYRLDRQPPLDSVEWRRTHPRLVRRAYPATDPDSYELESPDHLWFAFDRDQNLFLRPADGSADQRLTTDGGGTIEWLIDNLDWGLGEGKGGARWSPDGSKLAALRRDVRGVIKMPIVHWLKTNEEIEWQWYPKAGQPIARQEVVIIDRATTRTVKVDLGDVSDRFTSIIGWRPDGGELIVARMDREYKQLDFLAADPGTGATRLLVSERQATFIKGIEDSPGLGGLFHLSEDGRQFILVSERDGWDHLYLYRTDGTLVRRLTTGRWPVTGVTAVDWKRGWVYFRGHAEPRIYDTHFYRVRLDGTGFQRLTDGPGMHQIEMSPSSDWFVDTYSSLDRPPVATLHAADGSSLGELSRADIHELVAAGWRAPEEFWVKAADGVTDLRGVLYRPRDFDPARRYPVVEYIYGGPQVVNAPRAFIATANGLAMSQLGFVTFVLDARGTPERGKAFQDVVYRNFGRNEIPDHVAGLRQLVAKYPFMDSTRVGIFGGSWGGYMTLRALLLAPTVYHAGLSIYPAADLSDHHQMIEAYMGLPATNEAGYQYASNPRIADQLRGSLLLVHGTSDVNAPFSASIQMVEALTRAGKRYELVVFPEQNHGFLPQNVPYWLNTMRRFFVEKLHPDTTVTP